MLGRLWGCNAVASAGSTAPAAENCKHQLLRKCSVWGGAALLATTRTAYSKACHICGQGLSLLLLTSVCLQVWDQPQARTESLAGHALLQNMLHSG